MKQKKHKHIWGNRFLAIFRWLGYYGLCVSHFWLKPAFKKYWLKTSFENLKNDYADFGQLSLKTFGVKAELINPHGVDLSKSYILVANHRSWLDQVALCGVYPKMIHFLANQKYWQLPLMNRIMTNIEAIPVKDGGLSMKAKWFMRKYINQDENILFFAEGTRGSGKNLLHFKTGAFKCAHHFKKEILPIYIMGSEQCMSKHRSMLDVEKGEIAIIIGKPQSFNSENYLDEMKLFEAKYKTNHDRIYDEFEMYLRLRRRPALKPYLPSMRLV